MERQDIITKCASAKSSLLSTKEAIQEKRDIQNNGISYSIYSGQNSNVEIKSDEFVGKEEHLIA